MRLTFIRFFPITLIFFACATAVAEWVWERLDKYSPPSMQNHSMVYDSHRDRLVVVGGIRQTYESSGPYIDPYVYEWDDESWRKIPASARPGTAATGAMVYDSQRRVSVFFGGNDGSGFGETLEWDGVVWRRVQTRARPGTRHGHSMAYDRERGVTVLFGGVSPGWLMRNDTWEYDGINWEQVSTSGPSARFGAAMTFDATRGASLLHGGLIGLYYGAESDLWKWDGVAWQRITPNAQGPQRSEHSLVYDPKSGALLAFGGGYNYFHWNDETWIFANNRWAKQLPPSAPPGRRAHASSFHAGIGKVAVFGGHAASRRYSDLWLWEGQSWHPDDLAPPAYSGSTAAFDPIRNELILLGGIVCYISSGKPILQPDTWRFRSEKWEKLLLRMLPPARNYASMVWDEANGEIVLFGGEAAGDPPLNPQWITLRDTWTWNGLEWRQHNLTRKVPPKAGPIWFDSNLQTVVMASNRSTNPNVRVFWLWNGSQWIETSVVLPAGTEYMNDVFFDRARKVTILREVRYNRTWRWDGATWAMIYSDSTPHRSGSVLLYDDSAGAALLYGGTNESSSVGTATWWDGAVWRELGYQKPGDRIGAAGAYDRHQQRSIVYGGNSYSYGGIRYEFYDDTWSVRWVPN